MRGAMPADGFGDLGVGRDDQTRHGPKNQDIWRIASASFRSNRETAEALKIKRLRLRCGLGMQPWRRHSAGRTEEFARFLDAESRELSGFEIRRDAIGALDQPGIIQGHVR